MPYYNKHNEEIVSENCKFCNSDFYQMFNFLKTVKCFSFHEKLHFIKIEDCFEFSVAGMQWNSVNQVYIYRKYVFIYHRLFSYKFFFYLLFKFYRIHYSYYSVHIFLLFLLVSDEIYQFMSYWYNILFYYIM